MWWLARRYSWLYGQAKDRLGWNLRGLGFLLRRVHRDHVISVQGQPVWLNHRVSQCYGRLISGDWNEPETHLFLGFVFDRLSMPVTFIDVGANIGEMVIDLARHTNVSESYAVEPIAECCSAISHSLNLNNLKNVTVLQALCGDEAGELDYEVSRSVSDSSAFSDSSTGRGTPTEVITLDRCIRPIHGELVLLADVEGYELKVLLGARRLIRDHQPLIIFEYNYVSKLHFSIDDIRTVLGDGYAFWRLRQDSRLDGELEEAWNCVAVPRDSVFEEILTDLIIRV